MKSNQISRPKVMRAIEPNNGLQKQLSKRLAAALHEWSKELRKQALNELKAPPYECIMTSPDFMTYVMAEVWEQQRRDGQIAEDVKPNELVCDAWLTPSQRKVIKACARALIRYGLKAKAVSHWFCNKMLYRTSADMVKALEQAHVSKAIIGQKWKIPVIKGQYISQSTQALLPEHIKWMTELITKMSATSCKKVQAELTRAVAQGHSYSKLRDTLMGLENMDEQRAARVARDQACKLNQFIQQENARALGIKQGRWIHVPGMYTSRESHIAMNRKLFDLTRGMQDNSPEAKGRFIFPGELPFCRCIFQVVIPEELLEQS